MTDRDKPKRWRPWQFGLRALLLLMFGAACFFAGWTAHDKKRQSDLERARQRLPSQVYGFDDSGVMRVN